MTDEQTHIPGLGKMRNDLAYYERLKAEGKLTPTGNDTLRVLVEHLKVVDQLLTDNAALKAEKAHAERQLFYQTESLQSQLTATKAELEQVKAALQKIARAEKSGSNDARYLAGIALEALTTQARPEQEA